MPRTISRRRLLAGTTAILALATGTFGGWRAAGAQYLSLFDDAPYAEWAGIEEALHRLYQGTPSVNIHALIVRFDSELNAERGRSTIDAWFLDAFAAAGSPLAFGPVDAMGTLFVARAYIATLDLGPDTDPYGGAALIVAQDEVYVYTVAVLNYYQADDDELNGIALEAAKATIEAIVVAMPAGLATPATTVGEPPVSGTWARFPAQADEIPRRYGITYTEDTVYYQTEAPAPLPAGVAATYGNVTGLMDVVARSYGLPDGETGEPQDVLVAFVELAAFDSAANAGPGFAMAGTAQLSQLGLDSLGLEETDADLAADEAVAHVGQPEFEGERYSVAVVVAQSGPYVVTVAVVDAGDEDALAFATELAQTIIDAGVPDSTESLNEDGTSTGGLWDKLPPAGADVLRGLEPIGDDVTYPAPELPDP